MIETPIGAGLVKFDDYNRFGRLVDAMEKLGAYNISYFPRKGRKLYAWFRGSDVNRAEEWLHEHGYKWERKLGKLNNFVILVIDFGG